MMSDMAEENNIKKPEEESKPVMEGSGACGGCCRHDVPRGKLHSFNWLDDVPGGYADDDVVEVLFKNTRKGFYRNSTHIQLEPGDLVAVEAQPGHDIGTVTLTGSLVRLQMRKAGVKSDSELKRVFRKARQSDIDKFEEAKSRENDTMIRSRKIAESLNLNMKIGDVEYQGDGCKAIFYYIADERVDFRQLIKILADTFKIRVEMKQIGARQEAGRIGGIGPCGRPLCCASWMTNFVSVATSAARYQDISLNPQKLAGQCAKLKCCLNFEADAYVESVKRLPAREIRLETADATYFHFKSDIFKRELTYSTDKSVPANLVTISAERAFEIIAMNKRGEKPLQLQAEGEEDESKKSRYNDILGQDITRCDKKKKRKKKPVDTQKQQGGEPQGRKDEPKGDGERRKRQPKKSQDQSVGQEQHRRPRQEGEQPRKPRRRDDQHKSQSDRKRPEKNEKRSTGNENATEAK